MSGLLEKEVTGAAVWKGSDMGRRNDWIVPLSKADIAEIDRALAAAKSSGKPLFEVGPEEFPLPALSARLGQLRDEVAEGRGFALLRGLPIARYSLEDARLLFWGLACHVGEAEGQDRAGNLMHQVTDTGKSVDADASTRGYETSEELQFHNDGGDAFMLLCVRPAQTGGTSKLMSVGALFNEILRRRPDLARVAQQPFHFDSRSQNAADIKVQVVPILTWHAGRMNVLHKRRYIETAQRFPEVPRLSAQQIELLDMIDAICNDPEWQLSFEMQAGDIQIGNNFSILHSRTSYVDDPAQRRLLLRIWMTLPNGRPLPKVYAATREFGQTYRRREAALAA
ncbi:MAG: TauD/TfdA family dioxygenase [Burkholderiales bacterium]